MGLREAVEEVDAEARRRRPVQRDRHVETLGLLVQRPEVRVPERLPRAELRAIRSQHRAHHAELGHRAPQLLHRFGHVLDRHQRHRPQPLRARLVELVGEPVVVGARERHRPGWILDHAEGEARRRIEHRALDPGAVEEVDPRLGVDGVALVDAEARHDRAALVTVERREERKPEQRVVALVGRFHVLEQLLVALDQMAIRVQHAALEFH